MKKKIVLVTGSSGFVGHHFRQMYADCYTIKTLSLKTNEFENYDFSGVDTVLHLAGIAQQSSLVPAEKYYEVNKTLTEKFAIVCKNKGVPHFVFYSSIKVYGYDGDLGRSDVVLNEDSQTQSVDPYGASKILAEEAVKKLESEKFRVAIIRPPLIYGPKLKGNMASLLKLVNKVPFLPFAYANNRRTVVSIKNLLHMTDLIIEKSATGTFIGTDGRDLSLQKIIENLAVGLGKKVWLFKLPNFVFNLLVRLKKDQMTRLFGSLVFAQKDNYKSIGYQPVETSEEGIKTMCDWFLAQK